MSVSSNRPPGFPASCFVLAALLMFSGWSAWAQNLEDSRGSEVGFFFEPFFQQGLAGVSYDLSASDGSTSVRSRLEFPQFCFMGGARVGITVDNGETREWLIEGGIAYSITSTGTMNDYDWYEVQGYPRIPFSYTESKSSTVNWFASFELAPTLSRQGPWLIALYFCYRYQNFRQVEDTVNGWQYVWNDAINGYDLYVIDDRRDDVLEYSLVSHAFGAGILTDLEIVEGVDLELRTAFTPVYVEDRDDHKLRTKLSTASGWGVGVYADLRTVFRLPPAALGIDAYFSVEGELIYYVIHTDQKQYWYGHGDEPDVAMGTTYTGIDHVISSRQFQVGVSFGFRF